MFVHLCRGDSISFSHQLLYHIMTLLKSCTDKSFEIVIDLTQATQINEPDVSPCVKGIRTILTSVARVTVGITGEVCCLCS